jgi:hypothetical protein
MRKVLTILFALLLAAPLLAQQRTGNLYGKVMDTEGTPLPGVTVTLKGPDIGAMTAVTSAEGRFRFLDLFPGKDYVVKLELAGFKTKTSSGIIVALGKNTEMNFSMEIGKLEEEVTVTAVSPVVETKKTTFATTLPYEALQSLPSARDPWVILQMTPSIEVDRENVGGNESGQQAGYVAFGGGGWNDTWTMDGINITDPAAMGASPTYYNYDIFEEINVTLGGADVDQQTGGVGLNMVSRRGGNRVSLDGRFYYTNDFFESTPHGTQADALAVLFPGAGYNTVRDIKDFGFNTGGPLYKDKAWWWLSYGVQEIKTNIINGSKDETYLNNYAAKINLQIVPENRFEFFLHAGDKKKYGRSSSTTNPSGWNQHGKYYFGSPILKIQDEHSFGNNLFVSAKYGFTDAGFGLWPGNDENLTDMRWYDVANALYTHSQTWFFSGRPNKQFTLHATYFNDNLLGASHEIKAGVEYVDRRDQWSSGYTGNMRVNFDYNSPTVDWDGNGTQDNMITAFGIDLMRLYFSRGTTFGGPEGNYAYAGFLQDTISFGRFNVKLGLRYDNQQCWFDGGTYDSMFLTAGTGYFANYKAIQDKYLAAGVPDMINSLLPGTTLPGVTTSETIAWKDLSPRLGLTWDVMGNGKTIAKLSGAIYGGRMGSYYAYPWYRGGSGGSINFWWYDADGNKKVTLDELYWANYSVSTRPVYHAFQQVGGVWTFVGNWTRENGLMWSGYDYTNPTATSDPYYNVDPNWSSDKTYEIIASVEREVMTDFMVGADFTWRKYNNWWVNWPYEYSYTYGTANTNELMQRTDYVPAPHAVPTSFTGVELGDAAGKDWYVWKAGIKDVYGWYATNTPSDYYDQYMGFDIRWNKRLSNKWMFSGSATLQSQKEYWGATYPLDPTNQWAEDGQTYAYSIGGTSGKINQPVFSRWMIKAQGLYQLPYDFNVSFAFNAREGHILDKAISLTDTTAPNAADTGNTIRTEIYGSTRLPTFWNLDLRLEKVLKVGDTGRIYMMMDIFNVFNNNILNRQYGVNPGTLRWTATTGPLLTGVNALSGQPNEVLNPRILRFGVRFSF